VTFAAENTGAENHELAFLPGGGDVPLTGDGAPDEDALAAAGAFELEAFGPGQTCNATYDLDPGTYTMFCIVETPEGTTHYEEGMRGTLTVG
jgi:plastocyanin